VSRAAALGLAVVLAACGDAMTTAPAADISGTWRYTQIVRGDGTNCADGGQVAVTQKGSVLSGTLNGRGGCENATLAIDYLRQDTLVSAQLVGTALRFVAGPCRYEGTAVGNPVTQAGGSVTCTNLASTGVTVTGSWEFRR